MWHDSEGTVHIRDKEPGKFTKKQFREDLEQPNPDPAAGRIAEPEAPTTPGEVETDGSRPAEATESEAQQSAPEAASTGEPESLSAPVPTADTPQTVTTPGEQAQPDADRNVVQPMPQRQPQAQEIPEFPQNMGEMSPEMQQQMQRQMEEAMRQMQQEMGPGMAVGLLGAALIPALLIGLVIYLISAYVLYRIGRKFGVGTYLQWLIPLYNLILLTRCAGLSPWWAAPSIAQFGLLLLVIPLMFADPMFAMSLMSLGQILNFIGYIILAVILGNIAKRLGKNLVLWVILALIPLVNLVAILILAFDSSRPALEGGESWTSDEYAPPARRSGRGGRSAAKNDEPPMLSAPPAPPKRRNPLDDEEDLPRRGAPPLKP
ncbi:hypothetical protein DPQ33_04175 [Oceanidesulfovibrio indonesiensis]|uniref:Uncharacterized protein n=1 Tax=Oceanidesulfovibrio indonesiensis TaxID=54767 RepID=A0A7M3MH05_9BACT|nr:hypothetical protein [Oceanidesulfovibrio indonesiensis]TVM18682.1 hypothetical protein DPQ33_04175 [Oceanidesulfovibrio indonesiensis]